MNIPNKLKRNCLNKIEKLNSINLRDDFNILIEKINSIDHLELHELRQETQIMISSEFRLKTNIDKKKRGIYLIYDHNMEIKYIGKSNNSVITRSINSFHNHNSNFNLTYIRYWISDNRCDINIYEPYLIGTISPEYNKEYNTQCKPSIKLPKINLTKPFRFYSEYEKIQSYFINEVYLSEFR